MMVKGVTVRTKREEVLWLVGTFLRDILDVVYLDRQNGPAYWVCTFVTCLVKNEPFCFYWYVLPRGHELSRCVRSKIQLALTNNDI